MDFHLVCVHPIGTTYQRGQRVTDPQEIARLLEKHDKRFVKIASRPVRVGASNDVMIDGVEYEPVRAKKTK